MSSSSENWDLLLSQDSVQAAPQNSFKTGKFTKKELALYSRKIASLLKSGVPIVDALKLLAKQSKETKLKAILSSQINELEGGRSFSDTLKQYPEVFDSMYSNLVLAGEKAGVVDLVMVRLSQYLETSLQTRSRIISASAYPIVVLLASVCIVVALLIFVVPQFEDIFESMLKGASLPRSTQLVLFISKLLQAYWFMFPLVGGIAFCLWKLSCRNRVLLDLYHQFPIFLPRIGDLIRKSVLARFARTLALLLESAVPILDALEIASRVTINVVFLGGFRNLKDRVLDGESLSASMQTEQVFPDDFCRACRNS